MSLTTLVICFFISQIYFCDHKYVFHLGKVFYHLVQVILNLVASMFLALCTNLSNFRVRLLMSHEKCPTWQVLFILKFGTFTFFFVLYHIFFKFIMFYSKCLKCHSRFFPVLSNTFCINHLKKSLFSSFSFFFLTVPIPL